MAVSEKNLPKVAIVIPAFNEEKEILNAISEMEKQSYINREIMVVDDGSVDRTSEVAQKEAVTVKDLSVTRSDHLGPSHARNAGARSTNGEIIFFGECDCTYEMDYVEKAVESLRNNPSAGAVCLTGAPQVEQSTLATRCIELENKLQHVLLNSGKMKPFYAWVFRREAFEKVGGYDERLFQAEDRDLFDRIKAAGYEIAWVPGINWRHKRNETLRQLAPKWYRRGRTRLLYSLKHRSLRDLVRELLPFWTLVLAMVVLPFFPAIGELFAALVSALFVYQASLVSRRTWSVIQDKSIYVIYLGFIVIRNFSTAIGYSIGLVRYSTMKILRREISHRNI